MIKRIIGILFVLATVVVIIFTAIGAGSYESMLSSDLFSRSVAESAEQPQTTEQAVAEPEEGVVVEQEDAAEGADDATADTEQQ